MRTVAEVGLGDTLQGLAGVRRMLRDHLSGSDPEVVDNALLVATELATNAVLHRSPPVTLRLLADAASVRVEVQDASRSVPLRMPRSGEAMTGRGLGLVGTLAEAWGVDVLPEKGKVVWAALARGVRSVVSERSDSQTFAGTEAPPRDHPAASSQRVRLGTVPTRLLMAAKAHVDNVVRELTLERLGTGSAEGLQPALLALADVVTHDFAEARDAIKRQAVAAAARGDEITDLVLDLPIEIADAGERYLRALEDVDRYARDQRMLSLSPPRSHQLFRRWYLTALIAQLRAAAAGQPPAVNRPFSDVLANETDRLPSLETAAARLDLLQTISGQLTGADSISRIAGVVVDSAVERIGVESARVYLRTDPHVLRAVAWHGMQGETTDHYDEIDIDGDLPGAVVARTRTPLHLHNLQQIHQHFPDLVGYYPSERSLHIQPLTIGPHDLGLMALSFRGGHIDAAAEVAFVAALADILAQALERATAMEQAAAANERLTFLADASAALSSTLNFDDTLNAVTRLMVPRLADWCLVQLVQEHVLQTAAVWHSDPGKVAWANSYAASHARRLDTDNGAVVVIRTGRSEIYPELAPQVIEAAALDAEHLQAIKQLAPISAMVVPLTGRSGTFGAITMLYSDSGRHYTPADVPFAEDVARRAALALETADRFRAQSGRLRTVTRIAEAAQQAILASPPSRVGNVDLAARYISAAAEAQIGGDLYEVVRAGDGVRLLIGDVRGKGLAAVRTATIVLGEFRAATAVEDLNGVARQMDRGVRPYLGDEDFITALLVQISNDGSYVIASCGHPPPLLGTAGSLHALELPAGLPLGLGADPTAVTGQLSAGDRLLLYTDGVIEARDSKRHFIDLLRVSQHVLDGDLDTALNDVLAALHAAAGGELGDDVALLAAQYRP